MKKEMISTIFYGAVGIFGFLLLWQLTVSFTEFGTIFPAPWEVLIGIGDSIINPIGKHTLQLHVGISLWRVFVGYTLSAIAGTLIGLVMGASKICKAIFNPIFAIIKPIPGIAWIPLSILWFGTGDTTIYFIIFVGGFSQMVMNSMAGAENVSQELIGVARVLGMKKHNAFIKIVLPSAIPYIFAGLQISLSTSWMAVLAAEMITATAGAGWLILSGMQSGKVINNVLGMVSIGVVGLILATLMRKAEEVLCVWKERG